MYYQEIFRVKLKKNQYSVINSEKDAHNYKAYFLKPQIYIYNTVYYEKYFKKARKIDN